MQITSSPEIAWLVEGLLATLLVGLVVALMTGLMLLLAPGRLVAVNARLSRWINTGPTLDRLGQPVVLERFFYRHHRWLGALVALGAAYVLARWVFAYDRESFVGTLSRAWRADFAWLVGALEWIIVGLHVVSLAAGLIIMIRPSLLKNVERAANQWHRGLPAEKLDAQVGPLDRSVLVFPRFAGLVVTLGSAWSLAMLLPALVAILNR